MSVVRSANCSCASNQSKRGAYMLKVLLWAVVIIFVIGLLVVFGVLDLIF